MNKVKPFLRWAGGKTWLTKYIENFIPNDFENYYEPFVGGGSMFLYLKSKGLIKKKAYLSDTNDELINSYKVIKKYPLELVTKLLKFKNDEKEYYQLRDKLFDNDLDKAARFIYLNKTSFNGIYRVNRQGVYNVPFGYRKTKDIFEVDNIINISKLFKNTFFGAQDFKKSCARIKKGDFIFLDPPYTVAHENNGFIHYNQSLFSWDNQMQLASLIDEINAKEAYYLVTNAAHKSIYDLYKDKGSLTTLSRASTIGGIGAQRTKYNEILLKNY